MRSGRSRNGEDFMRGPRGPRGPRFEQRELGHRQQVILDQQYVEVVNSGDPASIKVQLDQQYTEVVNSGDPASIFVRLNQQYIEVVCTFGTPPVKTNNGKKDNPPGKVKAAAALAQDVRWRNMQKLDRKRGLRRFQPIAAWAPVPPPFIAAAAGLTRYRNVRRVITTGNDGHTVRIREG